jgi:hypothetical protein
MIVTHEFSEWRTIELTPHLFTQELHTYYEVTDGKKCMLQLASSAID